MDNRKLLLELINAKSEEEVLQIITKHSILSKDENWQPYGGYTGNFNTINNQAQKSVPALTEKIINSIDHLLIKECKLKGIDPESNVAPDSMQKAVELFFGIKKGDFSDIGTGQRRLIAENIILIAEGLKQKPNISIVDNGEGQYPDDFENTFVSLHRGNKDKILFVQGKYNMGGTAVLPYCGEYHYQLIISKPPKELLNGKEDKWGFTLVHLHKATSSQYKNSWYEYAVDDNGKVLMFPGEPLAILPDKKLLESGTYIKLFNYTLPDPSVITLGLWRELNRCLHAPAFPIMLYETREYKGHSPSKILLGNKIRIMVDDREKVEEHLTITTELGRFGKRNIEITLFKVGASKTEFTTPNDAIFFTINGQTHATIGRSFLKTQCNLYYLADYLLIHIDCTGVEPEIRELVFMPSRDRMREDHEFTKEIKEILSEELRKHEGLNRLNQLRREQQIIKNPKDIKFLENMLSTLIASNRSLVQYLGIGGRVTDKTERGKKQIEEFKGKRFPTYLQIKGFNQITGTYKKQIPINSFTRLELETDAENNYFDRETETGELIIKPDIMKSFHLYNGIITIKLVPPKNARVGGVDHIVVELTRVYYDSLFVEINVEYAKPIELQTKQSKKRETPKGKSYSLPEPTLVYKDLRENCKTWQEMDPPWTDDDIVKVVPSGTNNGKKLDIFINMDAGELHNYSRRHQLSQKRQEFVTRCWQTSIYLNSLILYNDLSKNEKNETIEIIPEIMKSYTKVALDLMCNDAFLKELERE